MPRPRKFRQSVRATFRVEKETWERFRKWCRGIGHNPSFILRKFIEAVLTGSPAVSTGASAVNIVAPISMASARAEVKVNAKLYVARKRLEDLVERAKNIAEREFKLVKSRYGGDYDRYKGTIDYFNIREAKLKLRDEILKILERYGEIPEDLQEEVDAALSLLKAR